MGIERKAVRVIASNKKEERLVVDAHRYFEGSFLFSPKNGPQRPITDSERTAFVRLCYTLTGIMPKSIEEAIVRAKSAETKLRPLSLNIPARRNARQILDETVPDKSAGPEEIALRSDLSRILTRAVNILTPRERRVLELNIVEGIACEDVGQLPEFQRSRQLIQKLKKRALEKLRKHFEANPGIQEYLRS